MCVRRGEEATKGDDDFTLKIHSFSENLRRMKNFSNFQFISYFVDFHVNEKNRSLVQFLTDVIIACCFVSICCWMVVFVVICRPLSNAEKNQKIPKGENCYFSTISQCFE